MDKNLNIVCFICARAGSKGVKNKNIRELCGKPLIAWSIETAKNVKYVTEVVISTDSDEIAIIAKEYGASVYFKRPQNLSSDTAGKWEVWQHALESYEKLTGKKVDLFLDLDCTAPLRDMVDVDAAVRLFLKSQADVVFSICKAKKNPYFNMVEYQDDYLRISKELTNKKIIRRQDAPEVYEHAASIYVLSPDFLRAGSGLLSGRALGYIMRAENCIDIDEEFDFELVKFFMERKLSK